MAGGINSNTSRIAGAFTGVGRNFRRIIHIQGAGGDLNIAAMTFGSGFGGDFCLVGKTQAGGLYRNSTAITLGGGRGVNFTALGQGQLGRSNLNGTGWALVAGGTGEGATVADNTDHSIGIDANIAALTLAIGGTFDGTAVGNIEGVNIDIDIAPRLLATDAGVNGTTGAGDGQSWGIDFDVSSFGFSGFGSNLAVLGRKGAAGVDFNVAGVSFGFGFGRNVSAGLHENAIGLNV